MAYIRFTDEQKELARQTDLVSLLRRQGEKVKRSGSEYEWMDGSQKVTVRGNLWFHQYDLEGGDAIDFVQRYYNKTYPEAVEYLLGECGGALMVSPPVMKESTPVHKGMIYESTDYHNAVFVGYDKDGVPRHAHKRGTGSASTYKGNVDSSLPEYSFHWHGTSDALYAFEAPIDMLSFITLHKEGWQRHSYAASCGVSSHVIVQMLKEHPHIEKVYLCHDNDGPGQKAVERIAAELAEKGIPCEPLTSVLKDWNQDLTNPEEVEETLCSSSMQML